MGETESFSALGSADSTLGSAASRRALRAMLQRPRFEVLPLPGVVEDVTGHLPVGATVTVTASPSQGPTATVEVAAALARRGYRAVPHLAARHCAGETELAETLEQLVTAGTEEVFIIGGDAGLHRAAADVSSEAYRDGEELLAAVRRLAPDLAVGVPGYPEGHPKISTAELTASLERKVAHAQGGTAYGGAAQGGATQSITVVGQLCFDPQIVLSWISALRESGMQAPVFAGIPGRVSAARLLGIAGRIGVGDSLRFLSGGTGTLRRLAIPGRYDPTPLAAGLAAGAGGVVVSGIHLYTFNALEETEHWRQQLLARLGEGEPA